MTATPAEFGLIARYFRPLAGPGALDLLDDAAVVLPPAGRELVITADALVEGVHFLPDGPPDSVGAKLLRVSLSDLAAMGATPWAYLTTVSVPRDKGPGWFEGFAAGLARDQAEYGVTLLGGDTTSTPGPVSLSLTLLGHVAPGQALRRKGAQVGHEVWVTGTIGDGALGLRVLRGEAPDRDGWLAGRYRKPQPRVALGIALGRSQGVAACMDVSDGLVQDLGHLCRAAGLGAELWAGQVPLSDAARATGPEWREVCLTGGDDYELLMAVPPGGAASLQRTAAALNVPVACIGRFVPGDRVRVLDGGGVELGFNQSGWSHF